MSTIIHLLLYLGLFFLISAVLVGTAFAVLFREELVSYLRAKRKPRSHP